MKTIFLKSIFFISLFSLITSCVKDDAYSTPELNECIETTLVKNKEVAQITASQVVSQYTQDDVIEAYITSSDISGNFFKSISFQTLDGSKSFSIPVDGSSMFINYEPGRKVLIKMKNLYTDIKDGGMRIGGLYGNSSGGAEVGRLTLSQFTNAVIPSCVKVSENQLLPTSALTIAQSKNDIYLNRLIELNNVQFSDCDPSLTYYDANNDLGGATNHMLTDKTGSTVILRVSSYANFASKTKALGSGKVRGIMTKYGSDYQFMVRTENDINLTGNRFKTLIDESFDFGPLCWVNYSVIGGQIWTTDTTHGNPGACMKISGFAGGNNANEDWLISPSVDLSGFTSATLTFDTAKNFTGNALQVYVSRNYIGYGDPSLATWQLLPATFASSVNYVWTPSGNVDITSFTGPLDTNVFVAFKYTSTTTAGSTWELDNVKITGL